MIEGSANGGNGVKGLTFNIQHYSIHDGPGIRTTVFLKKCPLKCIWCQNPEGINGFVEIGHSDSKCQRCYKCVMACPEKAIRIPNEGDAPEIDRNICKGCAEKACIDACSEGALELIGRYQSVDEVYQEVVKDGLFYRNSGGGRYHFRRRGLQSTRVLHCFVETVSRERNSYGTGYQRFCFK